MTSPSHLPDQDFELLSAYLDDQLSPSARAALEQRLAAEPSLRAALDELQQTTTLLKAAPHLVPPRNFTLDPARYGRRVPWWARSGAMQLIGAVGAAASVILIVLGVVLTSGQNVPASMSVPQSAAKSAVAANVTATNIPPSNAAQNQAAVLANTATNAPLTPKVAQSSRAISPTLAPTLVLAVPTDTAYAAQPTLPTRQAFALAATPLPTATTVISSAAAPAGPLAPRPNSAAVPSGGAAGAQSNGQVSPSNAPPAQTDQLSGGLQAATQLDETQQSLRDMTQVAQVTESGAFQTTESPTDNKDQAASGGPKTQVTPSSGSAASAAEAATMAATSAAIIPTASPSTTATFTSSPLPPTAAGVAVVPTALDKGNAGDHAAQQVSPQVPILLIAGIALLVFSVMLFALGWLRSRLSRQDK